MGLSLAHITRLLAGQVVDLDRTLAMQQAALVMLRARAEEGLALIRASRHRIAAGETIAIDDLINIARETDMTHDTAEAGGATNRRVHAPKYRSIRRFLPATSATTAFLMAAS